VRYTKASQKEQRQHGKQQEQMGNECHATPDFKATPPNSTRRSSSTENIKKNSIGALPEANGKPITRRSGSAAKKKKDNIPSATPDAKGTPSTRSRGNEESKSKS
jgi:hypothetical protein